MKYLKNAFELYINSSIHVSLAIVSFTIITILEHDLLIDENLFYFIFFASITGYNFVKYAGIAKLHHLSLAKNLRFIQLFSLLCFVTLVYFSFKQSTEVLISAGIMGFLTLFYAVPFLGFEKNLRSLPGLKIFIIALVWAGTTVILPILNAGKLLDQNIIIDFLQRLILVIVLTLPFEIRDLDYDNENLGTIPQKLGVHKTKVFGSILIFLIFSVELFQSNFSSNEFLALTGLLILTSICLWFSKREQAKYFASFWVEGLPLIYLGFYLILRFVLPRILS
ncbi:hypothetical protein ML462_12225 [Gramella lutea]|uniref:Prenyltransferase n=1 Tax=Christiangramia lutea TaxID=1607951 RepID=A0A9X1V4I6_9FLAO|nr:hypothetical protein [Christiangramia lutea]MCH4823936.1 hypothetical protein [Christiangramia lutea]